MTTETYDLGIDLDGVVYPWSDALRRYLATQGRDPRTMPDPTVWYFHQQWDMSEAEFMAACVDGVNAGIIFATGEPFPGARAALTALHEAGHRLHIITDRSAGEPGLAQRFTREWLARWSIPYSTLTFSADKTCLPTVAFIDDRPKNCQALAEAGTVAWMQTRPYNLDVPWKTRVASLTEFAALVLSGRHLGDEAPAA